MIAEQEFKRRRERKVMWMGRQKGGRQKEGMLIINCRILSPTNI